MAEIFFDQTFTFDPNSSSNFLQPLDQPSQPYTVFDNTTARWIVRVTAPSLGFTYVGFFPATSFVPAPSSSKLPPLGVVDAVVVYDNSGFIIAVFDQLGDLGKTAQQLIDDPTLIVSGDDLFAGSDFFDMVHLGAGSDTIYGFNGDDQLFGDDGDDFLDGGGGNDIVNGGAGEDQAFYDTATAGVTVSLLLAGAGQNTGGAGSDTLVSIEDLYGSPFNDTLTGDAGSNIMWGAGGDDVLNSGAGVDFLDGGSGNDNLNGGDGDDFFISGNGSDTINGGLGFDAIFAFDDIAGVTIHLAGGWAQDGWGTFDTLSNLEDIFGSDFNDTLVGNSVGNIIGGGAGDDWLVGLEGDDTLEGGAGVNVLIGGTGVDLASYASQTANLWIDMPAGVYSAVGVWDVFFDSIDGVLGGSGNDSIFGNASDNTLDGGAGNDALIGNAGNDVLMGGAGSDWIVAGDGDDRLVGGDGVDVLTGGNGADTFDLGTAAGWDVAFDFNTGQDRFLLGGLQWLGFLTIDADGDGQSDDTLLGYAGGNFVALNVSGLSLAQWNALVGPPAAPEGSEKAPADPGPEVLPTLDSLNQAVLAGFDIGPDATLRHIGPARPVISPLDPEGWGPLAA